MLGNILIDKIRFSVKRNDSFNPYDTLDRLNTIMSEHFRDKNYAILFDKSYFRLTFTPTLYLDSVEAMEGKPILNLDMINEKKFLALLKQIYDVLKDNAVVTWIDLTKNILTNFQTQLYVKAMSRRQFRYPYRINDTTSQCVNTSLTLSPVKRKDEINSRNTNRQMTLYDDVAEATSKTRIPFVDNVFLSEDEIAQIPEVNYDRETGRLWLNGIDSCSPLHLLRFEQRYKYTINIKRITHHLIDSKDADELTLPILIELLEKGELYSKLEEFYTNELRKYVFFDDIEKEQDIKLNKNEQMIVDKMLEYDDIDINTFEMLFFEIGYKNQFKYSTKKILYHAIGQYYQELYEKLNIIPAKQYQN